MSATQTPQGSTSAPQQEAKQEENLEIPSIEIHPAPEHQPASLSGEAREKRRSTSLSGDVKEKRRSMGITLYKTNVTSVKRLSLTADLAKAIQEEKDKEAALLKQRLSNIVRQGYQMAKGTFTGRWSKKYMVLSKTDLRMYSTKEKVESGEKAEMKLPLKLSIVDEEPDARVSKRTNCYSVTLHGRTVKFSADSPDDKKQWMGEISKVIQAQF